MWSIPQAENREVENLDNWFYANPGAINANEAGFIQERDDLISVVTKLKSPLRRGLEKITSIELSPIFQTQPVLAYPPDKRFIADNKTRQAASMIQTWYGTIAMSR